MRDINIAFAMYGLAVLLIGIIVGISIGQRVERKRKSDSHSEIPFDLPHKDHSDRKF